MSSEGSDELSLCAGLSEELLLVYAISTDKQEYCDGEVILCFGTKFNLLYIY